jgi:hypothetical protein
MDLGSNPKSIKDKNLAADLLELDSTKSKNKELYLNKLILKTFHNIVTNPK